MSCNRNHMENPQGKHLSVPSRAQVELCQLTTRRVSRVWVLSVRAENPIELESHTNTSEVAANG